MQSETVCDTYLMYLGAFLQHSNILLSLKHWRLAAVTEIYYRVPVQSQAIAATWECSWRSLDTRRLAPCWNSRYMAA